MDPKACLREAITLLASEDVEASLEKVEEYDTWRKKDGFCPTIKTKDGREVSGDVVANILRVLAASKIIQKEEEECP